MRQQQFLKLSHTQQLCLLISMHIRNEMEEFHGQHLSDEQMKELNPIIRQAIFDVLDVALDDSGKTTREQAQGYAALGWLTSMIPDYWEIPDKASDSLDLPKHTLDKLTEDD
jgi:hypothetical protein